ncbi:hypothetical protein I350_02890 [Cryptococcus amylolentus CBS 6273]|uniref:C3H1-type domain-containing protein n=1 Tax=Cryptococcus amylolentus CBS 6273 TaxID=1296118 RepID=A0A1E3K821_9TREE|nr:hypothetical protein I350_02890 [Cryptococcus amylolentus CBS 6273]
MPSPPRTPSPTSPMVQLTHPTPPTSFAAHRLAMKSAEAVPRLSDFGSMPHGHSHHGHGHGHVKRPSISSASDPIVDPSRRVSFSSEAIGEEPKSPVYQIPQRSSNRNSLSLTSEKELASVHEDYATAPSAGHKPGIKPRPVSFQGPLPVSSDTGFATTPAGKGLTISPSLARSTSTTTPFGSIWSASATLPSNNGWITPALNSAKTTIGSGTTAGPGSQTPASGGGAAQVAKARGLAVAIVKEDGGVVPVTPTLGSAGLRSPGLKSPELKLMRVAESSTPGLGSGKLDTGKSMGKKEIILCKFYHTPGLTCTSRPCRFVHSLTTLKSPSFDISHYTMLSPTRPADPTSGTFAHAQAQLASPTGNGPAKQLKVTADGVDLEGVEMGERVVVEDENGEEVTGQVFLMSGGGKGAGGKGRDKYKTVPCKDFAATGQCPYGDYCSFLHDEKPRSEPAAEQSQSTPTPASLDAWSKAIPKARLVPSVKVDPQAIEKAHTNGLSAFAGPFHKPPFLVDQHGDLLATSRASSPGGVLTPQAQTPPALASEPASVPMASASSAPPQANAWNQGPPMSVKKVRSLKKVTISNHRRELSVNVDAPLTTPTSVNHLVPPVSAASIWTESDPATPFDPYVQRQKIMEMEAEARRLGLNQPKVMPRSGLANLAYDAAPQQQQQPQVHSSTEPSYLPFAAPTYPWGMPMSPVTSNGQEPSGPEVDGGLGVMWTPAGWAVQDAAMKNALRSAEVKMRHKDAKRRKPKNYYRTRPCKFFAEGHCPHGAECTFLHIIPASSPEPPSSSDSDSVEARSRTPQQHQKYKTLPCKFFNSSAGCVNGDDCAFLHTRVVPDSVQLVERPRPWRTKPCRHYQLGRCMLGDACHFAHVEDPAWVASGAGRPRGFGSPSGMPSDVAQLTEESVEQTLEKIRDMRLKEDDEDEEDDDIQFVTHALSPSSSGYHLVA